MIFGGFANYGFPGLRRVRPGTAMPRSLSSCSEGVLFFMKRLDVREILPFLQDSLGFLGAVARCCADVADSGEVRLEFKNRPD